MRRIMKPPSKIGDRVKHEFLGLGTVKGYNAILKMTFVLFDVTPPDHYNGGCNPCFALSKDVEIVSEKEQS